MRRTQQNHMHHMETAASEMQALQVCLMRSGSTLACIPPTTDLHMRPIVHTRTKICFMLLRVLTMLSYVNGNGNQETWLPLMQARCSEFEEQQARLSSQIKSAEQRCAATQETADGLQQANVHLRQQLSSSQAAVSQQVLSCFYMQHLTYLT